MSKNIERIITLLSTATLITAGSMAGHAQSECFTYEDENTKTTICGLTTAGQAKTELTIPQTVTTVRNGAFTGASSSLTGLTVENGGNPAFESGLFGEDTNTLTSINMGDAMSGLPALMKLGLLPFLQSA